MSQTSWCGRIGCGEPASCVLLMAPQDQEAWLVGLDHEFAPDGVSLCVAHADRITVPFGWSLSDQRPAARPKRPRKRVARASRPEPVETELDLGVQPRVAAGPAFEVPAVEAPAVDEPGGEPEPVADIIDEAEPVADIIDETDETDEPTIQIPAVLVDHPSSPSEVPMNAARAAAGVATDATRLSVVPGEDDPSKTFEFEDDGQGALWAGRHVTHEPDERTPMLKRAFRVVRDD